MSIRDLKEKYGKSLNSITALNRAVQREIPGGEAVFTAVRILFPLKDKEEYKDIYAPLKTALEEMRDFIAEKYELKNREERKNGKGTIIDGQNGHQGLAGGSETGNP